MQFSVDCALGMESTNVLALVTRRGPDIKGSVFYVDPIRDFS